MISNKLIVALVAGAFALVLVSALADDKTPAQPDDEAKLKAERVRFDSSQCARVSRVGQLPHTRRRDAYPGRSRPHLAGIGYGTAGSAAAGGTGPW